MPGNEVTDDEELSRGGYAVANWNDTNGNGATDLVDHPCSAGIDGRGYNEYDTMKLVINKPDPVIPGQDTLIFQATNGMTFWQTPNKVEFLNNPPPPTGSGDQGWYWELPLSVLPLTVYVEVIRQSTSLKDMYVQATYNNVTDTVPLTGIWVDSTAVTSDLHTNDELKQLYPDMDQSILDNMVVGTGVWPTNVDFGTSNGIVFQFTVMPPRGPNDGTWEGDNIFFDVTRRVDGYIYQKPTTNSDWVMTDANPWPYKVEAANDDPAADIDSSKEVTPLGHLYSADTPSLFIDNPNEYVGEQLLMNCREYVRVEIDAGQRVSGNGWKYSRGSDVVAWHSEIWCVPDILWSDAWVRRADDMNHNEIGTGADINNGYPF